MVKGRQRGYPGRDGFVDIEESLIWNSALWLCLMPSLL